MSDADNRSPGGARPFSSVRRPTIVDTVVRRAVLIGILIGALVGLAIGAIVLNIVSGRREAAIERENQKLLDDWNAEQERKLKEERRRR
jgi:hypothetical protein